MPSDAVASAIIDKATLHQYLDALTPLVDECKLHMGDDGWHVTCVDPANVAMADWVNLPPRGFEHYEAPGAATIGLNIEALLNYTDGADDGQPIEVTLDMENRKLRLHYGQTETAMSLIDPDAIRTEPDTPDLDLPNTVVLEGRQLSHAVEMSLLVSDHIELRADPDARTVELAADGDTDETTTVYGDEDLIDARVDEQTESIYSNKQYLQDLVKAIPADAEVELTFGHEFPMRLSWSVDEIDVRYMLAPRIQSK